MKKIWTIVIFSTLLTACTTSIIGSREGASSSLVDFLYPNGEVPPNQEQPVANLQLPLRVGLAFVPSQDRSSLSLPEAKKTELLEGVKDNFESLDYVSEIIVIPDTYMRSSNGFESLDQLSRMYGLDIIALVSYDQVTVTSDRKSSLMYWTIVGAYFIKGNENRSTTFVDTAVFDMASRKLLFRAPGISDIQDNSTLIEIESARSDIKEQGFETAMQDMADNLKIELDKFEERIKNDESVQVTAREGYGGGGSTQWYWLVLIFGLVLLRKVLLLKK